MTPSAARIVIAPDSFKGSISATLAARALAEGWSDARPQDTVLQRPMGDGGEGTLDAFEAANPASERHPVRVMGPDGRSVQAHWLRIAPSVDAPAGTGVVELARTSGIELLDVTALRPLTAHTLGFGQAIADALDSGVSRLLVTVGGSASSDGGSGALRALGARFLDHASNEIALGASGLSALDSFDRSRLRPLPPGGAVVLTDVNNPLLGKRGAARVFSAQKGASLSDEIVIEAALARWSRVAGNDPGVAGAGAGGGAAYGLHLWGASIQSGAAVVADLIGLDDSVRDADLVITGEGRFDDQTSEGKAPHRVCEVARRHGVQVAIVAGVVKIAVERAVSTISLSELAGSSRASLQNPGRWLRIAGRRLARQWVRAPEGGPGDHR